MRRRVKQADSQDILRRRLPLRYIFDNNYFNDRWQGIPIGGYTQIIEKMFSGADIQLETDYFSDTAYFNSIAETIVYTGTIDRWFDYSLGELEYRSLRFETEELAVANYQGNAVINYTDAETPYTRIIEHKHFEPENTAVQEQPRTVITHEYPADWQRGCEPYYPVNDEKNNALYQKYAALAAQEKNVIFGGRLGQYQYYDMDKVIAASLELVNKQL